MMSAVTMANATGDQSRPMTAHGFIAVVGAAILATRFQAHRPRCSALETSATPRFGYDR